MAIMNMIQAINSAHKVSMARDPDVVVFGEDVGYFGGVFRATEVLIPRPVDDQTRQGAMRPDVTRLTLWCPFSAAQVAASARSTESWMSNSGTRPAMVSGRSTRRAVQASRSSTPAAWAASCERLRTPSFA